MGDAANAASHTGLFGSEVGKHERVTARVVQRHEKPETERLREDEPAGSCGGNGGKKRDEHAESHGVKHENAPVAKSVEDARHYHL